MTEYNKTFRATIKKIEGLKQHLYTECQINPNCQKWLKSLDSLAQIYLDEINTYTKKYIDENLTSLVSLVALYQQVAPSVYVLNPSKDIRYFDKG